mgnify:FL=1
MLSTVENARSHVKYTEDMTEQTVREQILAAADELYYRKGYAAVGMDELRAAAGLSLIHI